MVYRIYVEKKPGLDNEARALLSDARTLLCVKGLEKVRLFNRYDAENIDAGLFARAVRSVFSEPQLDDVYDEPELDGAYVFAVEFLPGQFDQRADSAAQCIQIISQKERPDIRSAKLYALYGDLSPEDIAEIKKYVINPVEAREASLEKPETLKTDFTVPSTVKTIRGAIALSMCINFLAIVLSVKGVLNPTTGALVHNAGSTFVVLLAALLYDRKYKA